MSKDCTIMFEKATLIFTQANMTLYWMATLIIPNDTKIVSRIVIHCAQHVQYWIILSTSFFDRLPYQMKGCWPLHNALWPCLFVDQPECNTLKQTPVLPQ